MRFIARIILLLLLFAFNILNAGNIHPNGGVDSTKVYSTVPYLRIDELISADEKYIEYGATRFLKVYNHAGMGDWASSHIKYSLDGSDFNLFPFNLRAVNLLPGIDYLSHYLQRAKDGSDKIIFTSREISDSIKLKIRGFTGSGTGDPLIHVFTRGKGVEQNKNKIIPSTAMSIENSVDKFQYRVTAGYFGFFSTGNVNDPVIRKESSYYHHKQNKQFILSSQLKYDGGDMGRYRLNAGMTSFYGWLFTPFISQFTHNEIYNYSINAGGEELPGGVSVKLAHNGSVGVIHETENFPYSKFYLTGNEAGLLKRLSLWDDTRLTVSAKLNLNTAVSLAEEDISGEKFFDSYQSFWGSELSGRINHSFVRGSIESEIGLFRFFEEYYVTSAVKFNYRLRKQNHIVLTASSKPGFPNSTELYGDYNFDVSDNTLSLTKMYSSGNSKLNTERISRLGLTHIYQGEIIKSSQSLFINSVDDPIILETQHIFRNEKGRILRSAEFNNGNSYEFISADFSNIVRVADWFQVGLDYVYTQNEKVQQSHKHKFKIWAKAATKYNNAIVIETKYRSKSDWNEFVIDPASDYNGNGFSGRVEPAFYTNIVFKQRLTDFYWLKSINGKISIENVFDNAYRLHPLGNKFARTILVSVEGTF